MYNDTKEYVKYCDKCQRRGQKGGKSYLNPIRVGEPFERIGIDFVGPLERTRKGNRYILVVTDYLTKWPEAKPIPIKNQDTFLIRFGYGFFPYKKRILIRYGKCTILYHNSISFIWKFHRSITELYIIP